MLSSNPFVINYALDSSKAFDTVWRSTLMDKVLASTSQTTYTTGSQISSRVDPTAPSAKVSNPSLLLRRYQSFKVQPSVRLPVSVVQGSAVGLTAYVVTASDCHPLNSNNKLSKYADDMILLITAQWSDTRVEELNNIEEWANQNNIRLNPKKTIKIIFKAPRQCRYGPEPPLPMWTPGLPTSCFYARGLDAI